MADICVIYASEDEDVVGKLITLLRRHWVVWWGNDIPHGPWDESARAEIERARCVLPILSRHTNGKRNFRGELELACRLEKPLFPLRIGSGDIPLSIEHFSRTEAIGWGGEETHPGFQQLLSKLSKVLGAGARPKVLKVREKLLQLPAFVFSVSSHETQVMPQEGTTLLRLLEPGAVLISAYDAWKYYRRDKSFRTNCEALRRSDAILFLDSGNYEAYRKNDRYSPKRNPRGWDNRHFQTTAARISPDLAFSFDTVAPRGEPDRIATRIVASFRDDERALGQRYFPLCPIVHLPPEFKGTLSDCAARIVSMVASELDPILLAIPERELGDGLIERVKAVRHLRRALDSLGKYYPLHLLGTGNPLSMIALAAAGADSFDGLEWCRTVADYATGLLFHFQQFECFSQAYLPRIQDQRVRLLIENTAATYGAKVLGYNVDFLKDWTRTMQNMIHSGQVETLLKAVPNIGPTLFKEISE